MNDLIVSDGKKSSNLDLGLRTTRSLNVEWPSPEQIAATAKRDTYPLTFRIDEVAYACLDLLAKQCDMSISNFVNELINSYIDHNRASIEGYVFNHTLNLYMERLMTKLIRLSALDILREYHLSIVKEVLHFNRMEMPKDPAKRDLLLENFYQDILDTHNDQLVSVLSSSADVYLCLVPDERESSASGTRDWTPDEQNSVGFADFVINIPLSKWVIASTLLSQYFYKAHLIVRDKASYLNLRKLVEVAKAINQYEGKELIANLVAVLKLPEKFSVGENHGN